jgi:hypothetical protein
VRENQVLSNNFSEKFTCRPTEDATKDAPFDSTLPLGPNRLCVTKDFGGEIEETAKLVDAHRASRA